tara:strand:- start:791 stop:1081 length:291 start_codon:yes stop_codon:yes gene_type:complete
MDSIKKNLTNIVVIIGLIGSIGAGFTKYGELTTRLAEIESRSTADYSAQIAVLEEKVEALSTEHGHMNIQINKKEIELLKVQLQELKISTSNPLSQ